MRWLTQLIGGLVAGLIGAAIWTAITYFTHHEISWIALGMGALVGMGVRAGGGGETGFAPGIVAAGCAVLALVVAKYAVVWLMVGDLVIAKPELPTAEEMILMRVNAITQERAEAKQELVFNNGKTLETAEALADFPNDIQQAAQEEWKEKSPAEQQAAMAAHAENLAKFHDVLRGEMREQGFWMSFTPYDILWFVLAVATAYQVAATKEETTGTAPTTT